MRCITIFASGVLLISTTFGEISIMIMKMLIKMTIRRMI